MSFYRCLAGYLCLSVCLSVCLSLSLSSVCFPALPHTAVRLKPAKTQDNFRTKRIRTSICQIPCRMPYCSQYAKTSTETRQLQVETDSNPSPSNSQPCALPLYAKNLQRHKTASRRNGFEPESVSFSVLLLAAIMPQPAHRFPDKMQSTSLV